MSYHTMTLTIDTEGYASAAFKCSAPRGSQCRLQCSAGCETWTFDGHEHALVDAGVCLQTEWLNAGDEPPPSETVDVVFDVDATFDGEAMTWLPAEGTRLDVLALEERAAQMVKDQAIAAIDAWWQTFDHDTCTVDWAAERVIEVLRELPVGTTPHPALALG